MRPYGSNLYLQNGKWSLWFALVLSISGGFVILSGNISS